MPIQLDLYGNEVKVVPKPVNKEKRNWENAFQRWSDKMHDVPTEHYGKCGYGEMCDYCDLETKRPCVRALNYMCKEKEITIDYGERDFEDIWNGVFK